MSESTRSKGRQAASSASNSGVRANTSSCRKVTWAKALAVAERSAARTRPDGPTRSAAYRVQEPGAAPRSSTFWPGLSSRNLASSS
jgi:hypothetical protein